MAGVALHPNEAPRLAAEGRLEDADGQLLAASRCTQVVLPADGRAGRYDEPAKDGSPPEDARG